MTTKNPNAILRTLRSSVMTLSRSNPAAIPPIVHDLVQAVTDLDNHLSWGGNPPDDWKGAPFAAVFTPRVPDPPRLPDTTLMPETGHGYPRAHEVDPVEDLIRRM